MRACAWHSQAIARYPEGVSSVHDGNWSSHARAVLEEAGHRRGGARAEVIDLLATQPCALSAHDIEITLRTQGRTVGRASIYRALEILMEHGLIKRLEVGRAEACYEPANPGGQHHHHVVCEVCGALAAFDDPDLERAIERLGARLGMHIDDHDVLLRGTCRQCAGAVPSRAAAQHTHQH
jgi:Fur family ferric uptake transcriptional regulator